MKKIIAIIAIILMAISANAQNININNMTASGSYFSGLYSTKSSSNWTVENLSIADSNDKYIISFNVFYVEKSSFSNDTTRYEYTGTFTKLTNEDGSKVNYKCIIDDVKFYDIVITDDNFVCEKYPERSHHYINVMIHYQILSKGYSVHFSINYNDWQKLLN